MPKAAPALAKLSRPKLYRVAPRERLFARLDECRQRPIVWIVGPPGAGKTTVVATYIQSRRIRAAWYEADAGDSDPGTFFYYLSQLGGLASRDRAPLPLLTPEYLADLRGFSRRFFRGWFARQPASAVLVVDNYHDVVPESPFHTVFAEGLGEIPNGMNVIVMSRTHAPRECARWIANDRIAQLEWEELRLTREETADVAAAKGGVDERRVDALHAQSNGWAAGLVLMLERLARTGVLNHVGQSETMDTVFNYFAGQFFDHAAPEVRRVLIATAFLHTTTVEMAQALSGDADARTLLEQLHRSHLFTERKDGKDLGYEYHALFRAFLRARARDELGDAGCLALILRTARLLAATGHTFAALPLYVENAAWDAAIELILAQARALIAQGRWLTLNHWIGMLPSERVAATPELTLWRGSSLILVDPPAARAMLETVFEEFATRDEPVPQILAATGIVESCNLEFSRFQALDPWIDVLERTLARVEHFPSPTIEIRAYTALMLAAMWRRPDHPQLAAYVSRVAALLDQTDNPTAKADVGAQLLEYHVFTGHQAQARALIAKLGLLFEIPDISRLRRSSWWIVVAQHWTMAGEPREAERAAERAVAIAREYEQSWIDFFDAVVRVMLFLLAGDAGKASVLLDRIDTRLNEHRPTEACIFSLARCMLSQLRGETRLATHYAEQCVDAAERSGAAYLRIFCPAVAAGAFVEVGEYDHARAIVGKARSLAEGTCYEPYEALLAMVEAYSFLAANAVDRARPLLVHALTHARVAASDSYLRMLLVGFPRMLAEALATDTEADYARSLIRKFDIAPPTPDIVGWPWPIRIETLGLFATLIDDTPLKSMGKTQRRPLTLLKFIIASGGRQVRASAAISALWRDFEGDAEHAFESTLHRLRKLLGRDDAVEHADGMLSLNPAIVWVDVWALERLLDSVEDSVRGDVPQTLPAEAAARALALYRGHFLDGEESAFAVAMRDRVRSKFVRLLCLLGDRCEAQSHWDDAARLYERGLELDNLAEELYRRLIVVCMMRGQRGVALEVYRRCRHMLSVILGVQPSAHIEALHASLRNAAL